MLFVPLGTPAAHSSTLLTLALALALALSTALILILFLREKTILPRTPKSPAQNSLPLSNQINTCNIFDSIFLVPLLPLPSLILSLFFQLPHKQPHILHLRQHYIPINPSTSSPADQILVSIHPSPDYFLYLLYFTQDPNRCVENQVRILMSAIHYVQATSFSL